MDCLLIIYATTYIHTTPTLTKCMMFIPTRPPTLFVIHIVTDMHMCTYY